MKRVLVVVACLVPGDSGDSSVGDGCVKADGVCWYPVLLGTQPAKSASCYGIDIRWEYWGADCRLWAV